MVSQISSNELITNRYASAFYDLSSEKKSVEDSLEDLLIMQKYINNSNDFKLLINSPLIESKEKLKIINEVLSKHNFKKLTSNFIYTIAKNKRINFLSSIIEKFVSINKSKRGDIIVDITSADELLSNQKSELENKLSSMLGKKLFINFKVDKKIIGGLIVKIGSKMIDSSLKSKINKLSIAMKGA